MTTKKNIKTLDGEVYRDEQIKDSWDINDDTKSIIHVQTPVDNTTIYHMDDLMITEALQKWMLAILVLTLAIIII